MWRPAGYLGALVLIGGLVSGAMLSLRGYESVATEDSLAEGILALAVHKHVGLATDPTAGGSSLAIRITEPSFSQVLQFLPLGVFTALFRPLIFEAHNVVAFIASLDGTLLLILVVVRIRHFLRGLATMLAQPFAMYCAIAFFVFAMAVSFESNFGVLVRHRSMIMPFLFLLLAVPLGPPRRFIRPQGPVLPVRGRAGARGRGPEAGNVPGSVVR